MSSPLRGILPWMLCCLVAGPVQAAAVSFLLDQSNELDDGVNYLQVRITDGRDGGFAEAGDIAGLPDGWFAHQGKRMSGFGLFDITLMGKGGERLKTLRFSITGVEGDVVLLAHEAGDMRVAHDNIEKARLVPDLVALGLAAQPKPTGPGGARRKAKTKES